MIRLLRTLSGFTLLQALGFIAPFIALPLIARIAGPEGWVHIASAQSIGTLTSIVILYGWWTNGPAEYHRLSTQAERITLYRQSVLDRLLVSVLALPISLIVILAITPRHLLAVSLLVDIAIASYGFTPDWLCIAMRSPAKLAIYETIPRAAATLLSMVVVVLTREVIWYPIFQIAAVGLSYSLALRNEAPRALANRLSMRTVLSDLLRQTPIAMSNILGSLYSQLSVPFATAIAPAAAVAPFVSAEKLYRASRFTIVALGNTMQGWTLTTGARRRHIAAIQAHFFFGIAGGAAIAFITPTATRILFGVAFAANYGTSAGLGFAFLFASVTTPLVRNVLIPYGHRRLPLIGTSVAAVVGLGGIPPLYHIFGVAGIAYAMAAAEAANAMVNSVSVRKVLRSLPASSADQNIPPELAASTDD